MVVVTLSACPPKLKGDITKWLVEIAPGVYIGSVSKRVRERLWDRIRSMLSTGSAVMAYSVRNEQSYEIVSCGTRWHPVDYDGTILVEYPLSKNKASGEKEMR